MQFLFLEKDLSALRSRLEDLEQQRLNTAKDASIHVGQSSESWHDNAGHELAVREQMGMAKKAFEMREMLGKAKIVSPSISTSKADIGLRVTLQDVDSGEQRKLVISSYQVLDKRVEEEISYAAPIISPFMGKRKGAKKKVLTPNGKKTYELIDIQAVNGINE